MSSMGIEVDGKCVCVCVCVCAERIYKNEVKKANRQT